MFGVCLFVCFVCSTLHSLRRAVWLPCAYAHHGVFVCLCLGLGCSVSCVEVAFIDVTSLVRTCVYVLSSALSSVLVSVSLVRVAFFARAACIPTSPTYDDGDVTIAMHDR